MKHLIGKRVCVFVNGNEKTLKQFLQTFSENGENDGDVCGIIAFKEENGALTVLQHSRYLCVMLGLPEDKCNTEELKGGDILSAVPWFARKRLMDELHTLELTEDPKFIEVPYIKCTGKITDVTARITVTLTENGERYYMAMCEDVAQKKIASLRTRAEQLISVFRYVYDEIGVLNFEKDYYANVAAKPETLPASKLQGRITDIIEYLKKEIWTEEEIKIWQSALERVKKKTLNNDLPGSPVLTHFYNYKHKRITPYKVWLVPIEGDIYMMLMQKAVNTDDEEKLSENVGTSFSENITDKSVPTELSMPRVISIRTFGYFDLFVSGQAVSFSSAKAKEFLAVLVDRQGGYVSSKEAVSLLWEDEPADTLTLSRFRKVALRLKQTLIDNGIEDLVITKNGNRRLNVDIVSCDLYDYLSGKPEYAGLFNGFYMSNYSWGENTLASIENRLSR